MGTFCLYRLEGGNFFLQSTFPVFASLIGFEIACGGEKALSGNVIILESSRPVKNRNGILSDTFIRVWWLHEYTHTYLKYLLGQKLAP